MSRFLTVALAAVAMAACSPAPTVPLTAAPSASPPSVAPLPTLDATPTSVPTSVPTDSPPPPPLDPASGRIAFIRIQMFDGDERHDVYAVDADGSNITRLTDDDRVERDLFWLNDGSRLVVMWDRRENPYRQFLASVRPDGTDRVELGFVQTYSEPVRSPDGRYVAFGGDGSKQGETGITLLDLGSGERIALTTDGATDPVWSPDGSRILAMLPSRRVEVVDVPSGQVVGSLDVDVWFAFTEESPPASSAIWLSPVVGGAPIQITEGPMDGWARWRPR